MNKFMYIIFIILAIFMLCKLPKDNRDEILNFLKILFGSILFLAFCFLISRLFCIYGCIAVIVICIIINALQKKDEDE